MQLIGWGHGFMRSAFQSWLVHNHKSSTSRISAVCLSDDGSSLYLGLSEGQLEEYKLSHHASSVSSHLVAKKSVGKTVNMASLAAL